MNPSGNLFGSDGLLPSSPPPLTVLWSSVYLAATLYGQILYLPIWPCTWKCIAATHLSLFKVNHTKVKVRSCSRLSLSPESLFKWKHTFTQRPRNDTTTSRLGQAMKGSMNNLTPNTIFSPPVMYTERPACDRYVCLCVRGVPCVSPFIVCMPHMLRGGYFTSVMWCVGVLSELLEVWQTHRPRADFLELHFVGRLQYKTCHLAPSRPCKRWLRHFCKMSQSRAYACEVFCVCLCACARWVIGIAFMAMRSLHNSKHLTLPPCLCFLNPLVSASFHLHFVPTLSILFKKSPLHPSSPPMPLSLSLST